MLGAIGPRDLLPPNFQELVLAGIELVRAQFLGPLDRRLIGLEPISVQAGRLLFERGGAPSVDAGIVMFHEAITTDKPGLRRVLRRADERAGRRPRRKRSKAQKLVADAVKAGAVTRTKTGQLKAIKPAFRRKIKAAQREQRKAVIATRKRRERAVLKRLGVKRNGR